MGESNNSQISKRLLKRPKTSQTRISTKTLAIRGSIFTVAGFAIQQLFRLTLNVLLTRLLFPEAFGLMAITRVILQGVELLSDLGISPAIIQSPRGNERAFLDTAWTLQLIRGLLVWTLTCIIAYPIARLYEQPDLTLLLPAAGLSAVISGLFPTKEILARRNLNIDLLSTLDIAIAAIELVVFGVLAFALRSVWALVFSALLCGIGKLFLFAVLIPGERDRFSIEASALKELLHFGKWMSVSTAFTFVAMQSDRIILGKLVSLDILGVYSVAAVLAMMSVSILGKLSGGVLMPFLSTKIRNAGIGKSFLVVKKTRWILCGSGAVCMFVVFCISGSFFELLYDARYHSAIRFARLLIVGFWFTVLTENATAVLISAGDSKTMAIGNIANTFATVTLAPLGFSFFGVDGFIYGWSLGNLIGLVVVHAGLSMRGLPLWSIDLRLSIVFALWISIATKSRNILIDSLNLSVYFAEGISLSIVLIPLIALSLLLRTRIFTPSR